MSGSWNKVIPSKALTTLTFQLQREPSLIRGIVLTPLFTFELDLLFAGTKKMLINGPLLHSNMS